MKIKMDNSREIYAQDEIGKRKTKILVNRSVGKLGSCSRLKKSIHPADGSIGK